MYFSGIFSVLLLQFSTVVLGSAEFRDCDQAKLSQLETDLDTCQTNAMVAVKRIIDTGEECVPCRDKQLTKKLKKVQSKHEKLLTALQRGKETNLRFTQGAH